MTESSLDRPLRLYRTPVLPEWVDYNGHMTESRYLEVMSEATDAILHYVGVDGDYLARTGAYFTAESHVSFLDEVHAEEMVEVSTQVLAADERRLHLFHRLHRAGADAAVAETETMLIHVDTSLLKASPFHAGPAARIAEVWAKHKHLPRPRYAGRTIGLS